jgi:RNA polymerase sigma-70 factor (ECF subfamily)
MGNPACLHAEMIVEGVAVPEPTPIATVPTAAGLDARFEELRGKLTAVAGALVGRDAAEDVVHDAYLRARSSVAQLRDPQALDAWLTRIVIRTAYNHHRRRAGLLDRLLEIAARRPAPPSDIGLRELVERLPARERTVLVLHYAHGYGLAEIGALLGISHVNVRTIIFRARRHLAAAWDADR